MSTAIQQAQPQSQKAIPLKPSALNVMAMRLSVDASKLLETLKATVFRGANNEELLALVTVANEYGLNPFLKEIYAFPAKGGGIVPVVSVDGWNKMLLRQESFDGIEFEMADKEDGSPHSCTAIVYVKGRSKPSKTTEYFDECKRNTDPWNNMPRRMLRNRTLCQASRMAFGFSGIYHEEEAIDVQATVFPNQPPPKLVETGNSPTPSAAAQPESSQKSELEKFVTGEGFTFTHLQQFGMAEFKDEPWDSWASFSELPESVAKRLNRARTGLKAALAAIKEGK